MTLLEVQHMLLKQIFVTAYLYQKMAKSTATFYSILFLISPQISWYNFDHRALNNVTWVSKTHHFPPKQNTNLIHFMKQLQVSAKKHQLHICQKLCKNKDKRLDHYDSERNKCSDQWVNRCESHGQMTIPVYHHPCSSG